MTRCLIVLLTVHLYLALPLYAAEDEATPSPVQLEFFESKIRPVLVEHCYKCHNNAGEAESGLVLDHRAGLLAGGDRGAAIVPGQPDQSLLVRAIRHQEDDLRMPAEGAKFSEEVVADFVEWIQRGAADPRDKPPSANEIAKAISWESIRERRKQWWSFQPIQNPVVPQADANSGSHPVDRFIQDKLKTAGLQPADAAGRATLVRRVTLALTGLPPTPSEVDAFVNDPSPLAYERVVDRLLASPQFGEKWARHWMDWFRYAESMGSEGDPPIPFAWRYRDYLIRALNADVPYDQLIREHLAGDLLDTPRVDDELGLNESAIGLGHFRMVSHGFNPVDAKEEEARFIDDQIDVVSKAILGLTVACARCHDHKFDPISQRDYYALFGIFASSRLATLTVDSPARQRTMTDALAAQKQQIQIALADAWIESLDALSQEFVSWSETTKGRKNWDVAFQAAMASEGRSPAYAWTQLRELRGDAFQARWRKLKSQWQETKQQRTELLRSTRRLSIDRSSGTGWYHHGPGFANWTPAAGAFRVLPEGSEVISDLLPAGFYTHLLSDRLGGVLSSPTFLVDSQRISVKVQGNGNANVRVVIHDYPRPLALFPGKVLNKRHDLMWHTFDLDFWLDRQHYAHIEVSTAENDVATIKKAPEGRSHFGITEVVFHSKDDRPLHSTGAPLFALIGDAKPVSPQHLADLYIDTLKRCVQRWRSGQASDVEARYLNYFVRHQLLPNTVDALPDLAEIVSDYRSLESEIARPTTAPGVMEGTVANQPLYERGDHKMAGDPVPRRFLEALGGADYPDTTSGRLELSEDMLRADNPLAARVIVNRIWHHLFGKGIVATPDNFGRLGQEPTHPELLDYLARRFMTGDVPEAARDRAGGWNWSLKRLIRVLVTSKTFRMSSRRTTTTNTDPANNLLSHMAVRRLDGEAIRDSLLAVCGQLDGRMYGSSVAAQSKRRSVYVIVDRNYPNQFMTTFDVPAPDRTHGRRAETTVPAQALTLLNSPFVIEQAKQWAAAVVADDRWTQQDERVVAMFFAAFARRPSARELTDINELIIDLAEQYEIESKQIMAHHAIWQDVAHALFNMKEFIYVR